MSSNEHYPMIAELEKLAGKQEDGKYLRTPHGRAALARLRRGLDKAPGEAGEMFPYVVPFLPEQDHDRAIYFLTASLFALHPPTDNRPGLSIGTALRRVREARGDSIEKRFVALLNAHVDDLPCHMRQAVSLIRNADQPIDWDTLLHHLLHWRHPARWVQLRCAKDFWGHTADAEATESADAPAEPTAP